MLLVLTLLRKRRFPSQCMVHRRCCAHTGQEKPFFHVNIFTPHSSPDKRVRVLPVHNHADVMVGLREGSAFRWKASILASK